MNDPNIRRIRTQDMHPVPFSALGLPLLPLLVACAPGAGTPPVSTASAPDAVPEEDPEVGLQVDGPAAVTLAGVVRAGTDDPIDLVVRDGRIASIEPSARGGGGFVLPGWIDSHVHLVFLPAAAAMADGGIAAAVDLAAPESFFDADFAGLRVIGSGPMVTGLGGYPTRSWGSNGYGIECDGEAEAVAAVARLADRGARVIKLPITGGDLTEDALRAATDLAHERGLRVASHALGSDQALLAARVGVDVLAHTPTQALSDAAVAAWSDRAVISTLVAFGDGEPARSNLRRLADAGATVLYGTDFGNTRTPGIDPREIAALVGAGFSPEEIVAAGTVAPASFWGLGDLGALEVGAEGSVLIYAADPMDDPARIASPDRVVLAGALRGE